LAHRDILRYEEILRIVRLAVSLGVTKVRITGGEPLVRKGIYVFLQELSTIEGLTDVSLTTNGVLLKNNLPRIRDAGISRINISLDTLNRKKFETITGADKFDRVWSGIRQAEALGFDPIKINVVVLPGLNEDEVTDMARLTLVYPYHVRFIEYMPIGSAHLDARQSMLAPEIKAAIGVLGRLNKLDGSLNDGPAQRYRLEGAAGEIGLIRPISHHFCSHCNRLRLTASGRLRPCLLSDYEEDIKSPLRKGLLDEDLKQVFIRAVAHKPLKHGMSNGSLQRVNGQMCAIGG
jgi:cyclic pyranopterin phosphate synthase